MGEAGWVRASDPGILHAPENDGGELREPANGMSGVTVSNTVTTELLRRGTYSQCPKRNLRFVHEHDKNDDFLPFLFMNTTEMAL